MLPTAKEGFFLPPKVSPQNLALIAVLIHRLPKHLSSARPSDWQSADLNRSLRFNLAIISGPRSCRLRMNWSICGIAPTAIGVVLLLFESPLGDISAADYIIAKALKEFLHTYRDCGLPSRPLRRMQRVCSRRQFVKIIRYFSASIKDCTANNLPRHRNRETITVFRSVLQR